MAVSNTNSLPQSKCGTPPGSCAAHLWVTAVLSPAWCPTPAAPPSSAGLLMPPYECGTSRHRARWKCEHSLNIQGKITVSDLPFIIFPKLKGFMYSPSLSLPPPYFPPFLPPSFPSFTPSSSSQSLDHVLPVEGLHAQPGVFHLLSHSGRQAKAWRVQQLYSPSTLTGSTVNCLTGTTHPKVRP